MNLRDIYYDVKPIMPRPFQVALRRQFAGVWRKAIGARWPIDPAASAPPPGWRGWPENKKFALVLTHDVEGAEGQSKCLQLMAIERSLGFRSAFNFVAEDYEVSESLRRFLADSGFEIGVHGIRHDGKDFKSRRIFELRAPKINRYLKEWQAVGFRAPATYCKFDWLHELDIEYDSSSFDTDPFELGSAAARTIFPYFIRQGVNGNGFVELPYTLPQDFTLFVIMREKNLDVWKQKLDWIAEHGGMALVLTHPDYMRFSGAPAYGEYSADYYEEFLKYVRERYEGQYWQALPREVARFWTSNGALKHEGDTTAGQVEENKMAKILMVVEHAYPSDSRVRKEALSLTRAGHRVTVLALGSAKEKRHETIDGVEVFRIPQLTLFKKVTRKNGQTFQSLSVIKSIIGYSTEYFYFTAACFVASMHLLINRKIDVIHMHNPPDTLFIIGLLYRLFGKKYIFDHHDLAPDLYALRYESSKGPIYKMLRLCEKASCKFSNLIISTNESYKEIEIERYRIKPEKVHIVRNNPVACNIMRSELATIDNNGCSLLYLGSINPQDGVENLIYSLDYLVNRLGKTNIVCNILGDGDALEDVMHLAAELNLTKYINFRGYVKSQETINEYLEISDIGLEPAPSNFLNSNSTFIKVMEYMAAELPVVAFDLKETRVSTNGAALLVPPNDIEAFAGAINSLAESPELRRSIGAESCKRVTAELGWSHAEASLLRAYRLLRG